ncbi:putative asparagine synthetase B2 [Erwinia amylovora Ea644]|uniref:asparagine synthetase B family protein n=2 Tax=Erwinia amylovora TaxID=552 RepID=UPI0002CB7404|nr:asparagine synthase-related protein [Erwinia amylovora]CCP04475.1 putative asparagine synthetase B2 [Erwinia amylovora Ea644]CCP08542.1 putative asparagine synthetase B2 [Erwinia amylovora MR1]
MCGIAGVFGNHAEQYDVEKMLHYISHRGETSYQAETNRASGFNFGTNRLAIVDENMGRQPFYSPDAKVQCVLNGEIYNHNELRKNLQKHYKFKSSCDSEVVLAGYLHFGEEIFELIQGMYAVAIYDSNNQTWYLARDHLGIKPLYYAFDEEHCLFSSELKSFYGLNIDVILDFPCGAVMKNRAFTRPGKNYRFNDENSGQWSDANAINVGIDKLKRAVSKMLPKKGEIAACMLSGGVDSSSILTLMRNLHEGPVVAYTFYNKDASSSDDYEAAKIICEHLNVPLRVVTPTHFQLTDFYKAKGVWMTETYEPALVRNAVSYHFLSQQISDDGFKFAISGEGADEVLGGYDYFELFPKNEIDLNIGIALNQLNHTYLKMTDRASMFATLEVRVPFLDEDWVAFNTELPGEFRIRNNENKWLLRNMMSRMMPDIIRNRPKLGMNQGAGFGSNDPGKSIYYKAISEYYKISPDRMKADLKKISNYKENYQIDESNPEEVFNFCRYIEHGFTKLKGSENRPQLNTSTLISAIAN